VKKVKNLIEKSKKLLNSWQEMAPKSRFYGMSLEKFRSMVTPAVEISESIVKADQDRVAKAIERDAALKNLNDGYLLVVNGIKGAAELKKKELLSQLKGNIPSQSIMSAFVDGTEEPVSGVDVVELSSA
jgi:hypothetical protein